MSKSVRLSPQIITFRGEEDSQSHELVDPDTIVYGSSSQCERGSSKVKLKNIVDYKWETKNYPGHLIAVHMDGKCVAYVIKVGSKVSGAEGMVRVISSGKRALIKGMSGEILDIQFAHNEKQHILACAEADVLHVYKIDIMPENLVCNILLEIEDPLLSYTPKYDKLVWCPYVPDDVNDNDDDATQLLAWARGNCFQCFSISSILNSCEKGKYSANDLVDGYLKFIDKSIMITWVALSPDGTTLSVGSEDGYIRFYQVYFHEKQPRCLHQWNPHNGKPISSFFFLDNLTKSSADAYWKYALTGANGNTEFKIWDCGTWDCLQILSFRSNETENLSFIADIDLTASYLIVSSIDINVVYVVQIVNDLIDNDKEDECIGKNSTSSYTIKPTVSNKSSVFMKSISEFPLSSPILSFCIVDATVRKYRYQETEGVLIDDLDDYDEENNAAFCVVIRMFVVQPKSVQECHIIYQPTVSEKTDVCSSISSVENYEDISLDIRIKAAKSIEKINDLDKYSNSLSNVSKSSSISIPVKNANLLGTDSFANKRDVSTAETVNSDVFSTILMLANATKSGNTNQKAVENMNILNLVNNKVIESQEQKKNIPNNPPNEFSGINDDVGHTVSDRLPSGSSSPSREVQQILAKTSISTQNKNFLQKLTSTNDSSSFSNKIDESSDQFDRGLNETAIIPKINKAWPGLPNLDEITKHNNNNNNKSNVNLFETNDVKNLNTKLDHLTNLLQMQSNYISEMKSDMDILKKQNSELMDNMKYSNLKNESYLSRVVEEYLIRHEKEHRQHMEDILKARNSQFQELKESIVHLFNQLLFDQLSEKQSNILATEVQKQITSVVLAKLDVIEHRVQSEIAQKVSSSDKVLKENILQLCKSKNIVETFGESVLQGVQNGLQNAYIQSMSSTLIPAYERSSREMFKQLHDTFSLGIRDVIEQIERYLCQLQPVQDGLDDISEKIQTSVKFLENSFLKQITAGNESNSEVKKELKLFETNMIKVIMDTIQKEIRKNFESQTATLEDSVLSAVRSQAHTPAPSVYDVQDQIRYLLYQGHVNKAFHQALIANDLILVEFVLEKADYKNVFNPCVLEQTVLLSLIQQISADMENHNDLKQRYLGDAILNLNHTDPIIKEHAPRVMKEFWKNCQNFLTNCPNSPLCSNIRMIMMAVQGMGFKVV